MISNKQKREWGDILSTIYSTLPVKAKNYANATLFRSMAVDDVLIQDVVSGVAEVQPVLRSLSESCAFKEQDIETLKLALNTYYHNRMNDGRYEQAVFAPLIDKPMPAVFVLSYNRPVNNATLRIMEFWNDDELFDNTVVFVQEDQAEEYKRNHPKFCYHAENVSSVGERFGAVINYCRKNGIPYAMIIEDDIAQIKHIKKGGVDSGSCLATNEEQLGGLYLKYIAYKGQEVMRLHEDVVMVGVRNRVMANHESTSMIGYQEPMRGGCPNMIHYLNIERFYPIWRIIPKEHYTPQSDWAIQCAVVHSGKKWAMITGIVKDENNSKSVIGYTGDREQLAKEYLRYYGVEDVMTYRRFKDTEMQGVKIFYNAKKQRTYETID